MPMNNSSQNPQQSMSGSMQVSNTAKKSSIGSIIATIVIIALIIIGGLYFWGKRIETERMNEALLQGASSTQMGAAAQATQIETVSNDDSLQTIDAETRATNTTDLSSTN